MHRNKALPRQNNWEAIFELFIYKSIKVEMAREKFLPFCYTDNQKLLFLLFKVKFPDNLRKFPVTLLIPC